MYSCHSLLDSGCLDIIILGLVVIMVTLMLVVCDRLSRLLGTSCLDIMVTLVLVV